MLLKETIYYIILNLKTIVVYKTTSKGAWCTENYGSWNSINNLNISNEMAISSLMRRKNLNGLTVVISTIISDNKTKNLLEDLT